MSVDADFTLEAVRTGPPPDGEHGFPLVVTAPSEREGVPLGSWLAGRRPWLLDTARQFPAVLFRGFAVAGAGDFESSVLAAGGQLHERYGDLPEPLPSCQFARPATPYPADRAILFHNEGAHLAGAPQRIWFHCEQPSEQGGATPLVPASVVLQRLSRPLRAAFEARGLRYVRRFVPGLDVPWRTFFGTDHPDAVAARCRDLGVTPTWEAGAVVQTTGLRPAVIAHPSSGQPTFFNQLLLHHPASLDPDTRAALFNLFGPDSLPRSVTFGDGSPIPDSAVEEVIAVMREAAFAFPWQHGDVLMLDNVAVAHARQPYAGRRQINVALSALASDQPIG
ncbi:TauD/TfdA family dioxygenase [Streptomyces sp. NPDC058195]|uniref:TauD/TfdA family dioxygenase n=1 Tax=Streptomyces sp. NPDC058195 TaxID=3346375 RepID=UPI0036EB224D